LFHVGYFGLYMVLIAFNIILLIFNLSVVIIFVFVLFLVLLLPVKQTGVK